MHRERKLLHHRLRAVGGRKRRLLMDAYKGDDLV
jgi:hypothetical protein